jgi:hypothetical protein
MTDKVTTDEGLINFTSLQLYGQPGFIFFKLLVSWSHCPIAQFIFYLGAQLPDPADGYLFLKFVLAVYRQQQIRDQAFQDLDHCKKRPCCTDFNGSLATGRQDSMAGYAI